ncbi:hypothetical protein ACJX0J_018238, partial [Zea mays]
RLSPTRTPPATAYPPAAKADAYPPPYGAYPPAGGKADTAYPPSSGYPPAAGKPGKGGEPVTAYPSAGPSTAAPYAARLSQYGGYGYPPQQAAGYGYPSPPPQQVGYGYGYPPPQAAGYGVSSMEVTKEFDPQNLLELFSIFAINLSSPTKDVQILTLRILSYFVKMDQRLITDEERPHKRQRTEVSGEEAVAKYANVVDILLIIESMPISVSTSRKISIFISRIQMSLSSKMVHDDYMPPLLHGIIGILYNIFSDLWPQTLDCLAVLIRKHKELVWGQFVLFIATHQSKGLTVKNQEKLEAATQPQ